MWMRRRRASFAGVSWQMDRWIDTLIDRWWLFPQLIRIPSKRIQTYIASPIKSLWLIFLRNHALVAWNKINPLLRMILGAKLFPCEAHILFWRLRETRIGIWSASCCLATECRVIVSRSDPSTLVLVAVKNLSLGPVDTIWYQPDTPWYCWNMLKSSWWWNRCFLAKVEAVEAAAAFAEDDRTTHYFPSSVWFLSNITEAILRSGSLSTWQPRCLFCLGFRACEAMLRNAKRTEYWWEWEFFVLLTTPRHLHLNLHLHLTRHLILHLHHHP